MWLQQEIHLAPQAQGFHLIFREIERPLSTIRRRRTRRLPVSIQHATASQSLNEYGERSVSQYFKSWFNHNVRKDASKLNTLWSLYPGEYRNRGGMLQGEVRA